MKIEPTRMLKRYTVNFLLRATIFVCIFTLYLLDKPLMLELIHYPIYKGINPLHVLWLIFMGLMIVHIFPPNTITMALRKGQQEQYLEEENYSEIELLKFVQDQNVKAWKVMLIWLCLNAVIGIAYLVKLIDEIDLLMITVFFFLCDYICILIFCPYQTTIMKNRCCVNCRIYDWGHFMMFTPMLFIKSLYSWSLFFTSLVVLIKWEINYAKHPERFWSGSNKRIQCSTCTDKTCQIKNLLARKENYYLDEGQPK